MATLVFKVPGGNSLQQIQVGPADIAATLSAAHSAWGWVGGMSGVRDVLSHLRNPFASQTIELMFENPGFSPQQCGMFTFGGMVYLCNQDAEHAFGGNPQTQMLGVTICALAHEVGAGDEAVHLFMGYLAPAIFLRHSEKTAGVREALYSQLIDKSQIILNEGAARGLTQKFVEAVAQLRLPCGYSRRQRQHPGAQKSYFESTMLGGFLRWLGRNKDDSYLTRSAAVARVAAYLKVVGYKIGRIEVWDGLGSTPDYYRGVVLVVGGTSETDDLMEEIDEEILPSPYLSHYRVGTIGALLANCVQMQSDIRPEVCQTWFEQVRSRLQGSLSFYWYYNPDKIELIARPRWVARGPESTSYAVRLASIYFNLCASEIAPFYEDIAGREVLEIVLDSKSKNFSGCDGGPTELVQFRIRTAIILACIACELGGSDFDTLQHVTTLDLSNEQWIETSASLVNKSLRIGTIGGGFSMSTATALVSQFHCGLDIRPHNWQLIQPKLSGDNIVGWRTGVYAVYPAILSVMDPCSEALGLRCTDTFIGNLPTKAGEGGAIYNGITSNVELSERIMRHDPGSSWLPGSSPPGQIIPAARLAFASAPADYPLYLSVERPFHSDDIGLCFCGRVNGEAIGTVAIKDVLYTIANDLPRDEECKTLEDHGGNIGCDIISTTASSWVDNRGTQINPTPRFGGAPVTYIPVLNDRAWTLFLAGSISPRLVRISFGCVECALESWFKEGRRTEDERVIIGYK